MENAIIRAAISSTAREIERIKESAQALEGAARTAKAKSECEQILKAARACGINLQRLEHESETQEQAIFKLSEKTLNEWQSIADNEYITRAEYARRYHITPRTVDRYIKSGKLKAKKVFNRVLIKANEQPQQ